MIGSRAPIPTNPASWLTSLAMPSLYSPITKLTGVLAMLTRLLQNFLMLSTPDLNALGTVTMISLAMNSKWPFTAATTVLTTDPTLSMTGLTIELWNHRNFG